MAAKRTPSAGMAHAFVRVGRGDARIIVRRPRIGVVRAGQLVGPETVERVFEHVVAGDADHVHEELA
jgi:hypothetical protein